VGGLGEDKMGRRNRVTIADVAALAGVSTTAVSLTLNNREATRLSADVVQRVRAAATELGYRPNLTARALSTRRTHALGFVSDFLTRQRLESDLLRGALNEARQRGLVTIVAETYGSPEAAAEICANLIDRQVDGLIFAYTESRLVSLPTERAQTPTVVLNALPDQEVPFILPDESEGARRLVRALIDQAHPQRIAVLGDAPDAVHRRPMFPTVRRRLDAIWAVLSERDSLPVIAIPCEGWEVEEGYQAAQELLATGIDFDAIICLNDRIAASAYRALRQAGLRIPQDVSVVSFDDAEFAQYLDPPLTTLALPFQEMATLAIQLVTDTTSAPGEHLVTMPLQLRASVRQVRTSEQRPAKDGGGQ
jgi:LacI family transcriptional regulator